LTGRSFERRGYAFLFASGFATTFAGLLDEKPRDGPTPSAFAALRFKT
jgi:hypothetical protein